MSNARTISPKDVALIGIIVDRAEELGITTRDQRSRLTLLLVDSHVKVPLQLQAMIDAARTEHRSDFAHDIAGIWNHWDVTGQKFRDCFCPRFANLDENR